MLRTLVVILAAQAGVFLIPATATAQGLARVDGITVLAANNDLAENFAQQAALLRDNLMHDWALEGDGAEVTISLRIEEGHERSLSFPVRGERGTWHKISLVAGDKPALAASLSREMTRVVLSHRQDGSLSPWIAAGIAGQQESGERREAQQQMLDWFARTGNWPELESLFAEKQLVDADRAGLAAATGIVELLLARGERQTLLDFADDAALLGWNESLEKHYRIPSVAALETAWHAAAKQNEIPRVSAIEGTHR